MTDEPKHDPGEIIQRVLRPILPGGETPEHVRRGSRRCVLVLDETTACLAPALRDANFWVIASDAETSSYDVRSWLLPGRILVTRATADYIDDAPVIDYGVVGLDALPNLATSESYRGNGTVRMMSRALTRFRLASRPPAWVILLRDDGEHVIVGLE